MSLSSRSRVKLQELAIRHDVKPFGIPYLLMIKRIVECSNLTREEETTLKALCKEMGADYDLTFKAREKKKE